MSSDHAATFPRRDRLKTPQQFRQVLSQGRRISAALFRLHVRLEARPAGSGDAPAEPVASARIGITVSKRNAPLAVQRNRIKRVVRESFRHHRAHLPSGEYVVLAKREAADASPIAMRAALSSLWQQSCALKPEPAAPTMPARAGSGGDSH